MKKIVFLTALLTVLLMAFGSAGADASGTCGDYGDNLTWTLTDGVLTISGEGGMNWCSRPDVVWWNVYDAEITSVVIEDGVTNISEYAFQDCTNLTSVSIPDSVTRIGSGAFSDCTSLKSISVPDSVTEIGNSAFYNCPLTSFEFPSGMTRIEAFTFYGSDFVTITIPEHITYIGQDAFSDCEYLNNVTLRNGLSVEYRAFMNCPSLKELYLPDDITILSHSVFDNRTTVYIEIGSATLDSISTGTSFEFRDPDYPGFVFQKTQYATNSNQVKLIRYENTDTTHVVIPEEVIVIEYGVFRDNTKLTGVTLPENLLRIESCAFYNCTSLVDLVIPDHVTTIGTEAFYNCSALTGMLQLPDSMERIERFAFNGCTGLTGVMLSDHIQYVDVIRDVDLYANRESETAILCSPLQFSAFKFIDPDYPEVHLKTYKTAEGTLYYVVVDAKPSITKVDASTFPAGTTTLGDSAFAYCNQLVSVTIPEYITSMESGLFGYCESLSSVTFDNKPTTLPHHMFSGCISLPGITLPDGLKTIGSQAFGDCKILSSVHIPNTVTHLEGGAFAGCSNLKTLHIPSSVTQIESSAFAYSGLTSITLPGSIGKVNSFVFYDCPSLSSVTLGEGITAIEDYAFAGVTSMGRMYIPNSCTSIGDQEYSEYVSAYEPPRIHSFSYNTTDVYCYEFSYAEHWGRERCRKVILLDGKEEGENLTVTLPETLTASVGTPVNIPATIFPESDSQTITWTSSNPDVASIDASGKLSPLKAGVTTITLTVDGVSATCEVTVYYALTSLVLPDVVYVVAKEGAQLPVTIIPADAACELTYSIDKANFGSISSTGWISAPSYIPSPNTATITVRDRITGKTATTQLCVTYPVTAVSFAQDTVDLAPGETFQLTANVTMRGDSCVNQLVTFTSSNEAVATVDQNGLLTAKAGGTATITAAASSGVSAQCTINVTCEHVIETLPAVAPTCTENGLTEGEHCSVCGMVITEQTVIPATGHTEGERIIVTEPTDKKPGAAVVYCTICNETLRTEEIPATGVVYTPGDASGDGQVDIFDALAVLQYAVGWDTELAPDAADVNDDGEVDIFDALLILQYAVGWDVELK